MPTKVNREGMRPLRSDEKQALIHRLIGYGSVSAAANEMGVSQSCLQAALNGFRIQPAKRSKMMNWVKKVRSRSFR